MGQLDTATGGIALAVALTEFLLDLQREISLDAAEEGQERSLPEAFTEYMFEVLTEAGEIDDAQVAFYQATGARASGFTLSEDESTLWLFLTDYRGELEPQSLVKADLDTHFRRLSTFAERAHRGLHSSLEESAPSWDMAHRIEEVWRRVGEVRLVILTNAILRTQVPGPTTSERRRVHHAVWDLERLHQLTTSGRVQESITVDVLAEWGEPIPCLGPQGDPGFYAAYLTLLPAEFIANIYEKHGPRLLELNVRSFLQSRGKVNRGIQETIKTAPRRFLAYNNGISMTASGVTLVDLPGGGRGLAEIRDLQIVNGGQTSASLHFAKVRHKADLSEIHVQAKVSVVEPTLLLDLVPRISEYANSQNRVNLADFSANDPFHVEIERLSRTIWAPGKAGTNDLTRWFYERARGQYADAHGRSRTPAQQRKFKQEHPVSQKFTKTDLAKFENTWDQLPHIVSLGAEKNFREFMIRLSKRGSTFKPDQNYFESLVAKAILFRQSERLVGSLKLGGYRSQTVTYMLARLLHATGQQIDLRAIWRRQELSPALAEAISELAPLVHGVLLDSAGTRNVGEWAKKEACWVAVQALEWSVPAALGPEMDRGSVRTKTTSSASIGEQMSEDEAAALATVVAIPSDVWFSLSGWAKQTGSLEPWQRSLAFSLGRIASAERTPSRKQAIQGARAIAEARRLGFSD
ncbi:AIPR family protein [Propioniciclava sp. MC1595]|uniref:AIPR family protein n=1 Tax=Propioniciclava sp. MC1595 TaxID=2760308 RepID=UPI0016622DCF|nr:AIPR family protein [Propioniciclava sp. MC1595]MBB1496116.1 AIPR family protein [Propioniciclava sp. MC1595]QTE26395.1 AIPR family protein [Propioniciclava sp. MC1595]